MRVTPIAFRFERTFTCASRAVEKEKTCVSVPPPAPANCRRIPPAHTYYSPQSGDFWSIGEVNLTFTCGRCAFLADVATLAKRGNDKKGKPADLPLNFNSCSALALIDANKVDDEGVLQAVLIGTNAQQLISYAVVRTPCACVRACKPR